MTLLFGKRLADALTRLGRKRLFRGFGFVTPV